MDADNFTPRTRRALHAAGDASAKFKHEYVGTEHLLLALLRDLESVAAARDDDRSDVRTDHLLIGLLREQMGIGAQVLTQAGVTTAQLSGPIPGARPVDD